MTTTTDTRTKGRHRATSKPQPEPMELQELRAENRELHCRVQRAKTVIHELTDELATQAQKTARAEARARVHAAAANRLRKALTDRWNLRLIDYPAPTPMYASDITAAIDPRCSARGLALATLFEPNPGAFAALDSRPVPVHDPEATQPVATITRPDTETTLTIRIDQPAA